MRGSRDRCAPLACAWSRERAPSVMVSLPFIKGVTLQGI